MQHAADQHAGKMHADQQQQCVSSQLMRLFKPAPAEIVEVGPAGCGGDQDQCQQGDDSQCASRVVAHVVLRLAAAQALEVGEYSGGAAHEIAESRVLRADQTPYQTEDNQPGHCVAKQGVHLAPAFTLGGQPGASEAQYQ